MDVLEEDVQTAGVTEQDARDNVKKKKIFYNYSCILIVLIVAFLLLYVYVLNFENPPWLAACCIYIDRPSLEGRQVVKLLRAALGLAKTCAVRYTLTCFVHFVRLKILLLVSG